MEKYTGGQIMFLDVDQKVRNTKVLRGLSFYQHFTYLDEIHHIQNRFHSQLSRQQSHTSNRHIWLAISLAFFPTFSILSAFAISSSLSISPPFFFSRGNLHHPLHDPLRLLISVYPKQTESIRFRQRLLISWYCTMFAADRKLFWSATRSHVYLCFW